MPKTSVSLIKTFFWFSISHENLSFYYSSEYDKIFLLSENIEKKLKRQHSNKGFKKQTIMTSINWDTSS